MSSTPLSQRVRALLLHRDFRTVAGASGLRFAAIVLGTLASVLLARWGGTELKGVASAYAAANALAFTAINFDLAQQVLRRGREAGDLSDVGSLLVRCWPYYLAIGGAASLLAWVTDQGDAIWLSVGTLCFLLPSQLGIASNGVAGPRTTAVGAVFQQTAMCGLLGVFHMTVGLTEPTVKGVICLAYMAPLPYFAWTTRRRCGRLSARPLLRLRLLRQLIAAGSRWQPVRILQLLLLRLDLLAVYWLLGASPAGVYSVGLSTAALAGLVPAQFAANATFTATSRPVNRSTKDLLGAVISGSVGAAGLASVGWFLIPLMYGSGFSDAFLVQVLVSPGVVAYSALQVITNRQRIQGSSATLLVASAVGVSLMAVSIACLEPRAGIFGIAAASSIGSAAALAWAYASLLRRARAAR